MCCIDRLNPQPIAVCRQEHLLPRNIHQLYRQACRASDRTTIQMPTPDTAMPDTICHDNGSLNMAQAQSIVTGGLRYKTLATRVAVARRRQTQ